MGWWEWVAEDTIILGNGKFLVPEALLEATGLCLKLIKFQNYTLCIIS